MYEQENWLFNIKEKSPIKELLVCACMVGIIYGLSFQINSYQQNSLSFGGKLKWNVNEINFTSEMETKTKKTTEKPPKLCPLKIVM